VSDQEDEDKLPLERPSNLPVPIKQETEELAEFTELPDRRQWPSLAWWAWALLPAGLALLYVLWPRSEPIAKTELPPAAPGWEELGDCVSARSFDGNKSLRLLDDGKASLGDTPIDNPKESERRQSSGAWKYDPVSNRYAVVLNGETIMYRLVSLTNSNLCMLVKGDLRAADLHGSWFSETIQADDDMIDDYRGPSPPNP
jgi:hypothetical protein